MTIVELQKIMSIGFKQVKKLAQIMIELNERIEALESEKKNKQKNCFHEWNTPYVSDPPAYCTKCGFVGERKKKDTPKTSEALEAVFRTTAVPGTAADSYDPEGFEVEECKPCIHGLKYHCEACGLTSPDIFPDPPQSVPDTSEVIWEPNNGEEFYYIDEMLSISHEPWFMSNRQIYMNEIGNCFPTSEEAKEAKQKIENILKGKS